jgi:RNA polymerase sigma factor (sigma-70 family)
MPLEADPRVQDHIDLHGVIQLEAILAIRHEVRGLDLKRVRAGRKGVEQELSRAVRLYARERRERRGEIETVVRALPANYRELIVLRHSQDLSYEEIVEVTGLPLGTVKNRLFRAREMMRQQFVEKGITGI